MADIQSSDFASALSEDVRTDENTSSLRAPARVDKRPTLLTTRKNCVDITSL